MLNSLQRCGDNYLPIFKFIHSLCCGGEGFLTPEEMALLLRHCEVEPGEVHAKGSEHVCVCVPKLLPHLPHEKLRYNECVCIHGVCVPMCLHIVSQCLNFAELAFLIYCVYFIVFLFV